MSGETNAQRLKRLRADAVARGLCYGCRCRFPRPGVRYCDVCIDRAREAAKSPGKGVEGSRRRSRRASQKRVKARQAAKLCIRCGRRPPEPGYASCSVCLDYTVASVKRTMARQGAREDGRRCTVCGQLGHFSPRHRRAGVVNPP